MRKVKVAFVAPGQGIEDFSDGDYLAEQYPEIVIPVYNTVQSATGVDTWAVSKQSEAPADISIAQPAVLAIGVAHAEVLKAQGIKPDYLIGFSAGEFTMAAVSGVLKLADAARYIQRRSEAQIRAGGGKGGVLTVRHRGNLDIEKLLEGLEGVWHTGFHSPKLAGFSFRNGSRKALVERIDAVGARIIDSTVPFAAHCEEVAEAQRELDEMIDEESVNDSRISIISIHIARAMRKANTIRNNMVWQTTKPTRFQEAMQYGVDNGVEEVYALAPGDSMAKMAASNVDPSKVRVHELRKD